DRNPEIYRSGLQDRFPEIEFKSFDTQPDRRGELQAWQPEVVFAVKRGGDPSDVFQAAVACSSVKWLHVGGGGDGPRGPRVGRGGRVVVTNSAGVLAPFHAETVIGAIFALNLRLPAYFAQKQQRTWEERGFTSLVGKSLLIVGLGRIGTCVAALAIKLGMDVR